MSLLTIDQNNIQNILHIVEVAPDPIARRGKLILAYAQGMQTQDAAHAAGMSRGRARYWKREFQRRGMEIFQASADSTEYIQKADIYVDTIPLMTLLNDTSEENDGRPDQTKLDEADKHPPKKEKKYDIPILPYPETVGTPGVLADDLLSEAGRKILRAQFAAMLSHEAGTRLGEDIEALHDMRVATRRMRAAFDVFGDAYKPKAIKSHLAGLRKLGGLLGSVRDLDVFMEKARVYLSAQPGELHDGLDPLLYAWQGKLDEARGQLINHLDNTRYQDFKLRFNYFVQTAGLGAQGARSEKPAPVRVCEVVPCLIYTRLAAIRAYAPIIENAAIPQLHRLRIEFKKLRYALEFFSEVLGNEGKQVVELIKGLQDHLGDLHDADVACQILNGFLETWDASQAGRLLSEQQNPEPIVQYLAYQYAERHRLLTTFLTAWQVFDTRDTYRKIAQAIAVL